MLQVLITVAKIWTVSCSKTVDLVQHNELSTPYIMLLLDMFVTFPLFVLHSNRGSIFRIFVSLRIKSWSNGRIKQHRVTVIIPAPFRSHSREQLRLSSFGPMCTLHTQVEKYASN